MGESDWKRRIRAEAEAHERPPTRREYFAPHNGNLPVLRREFLSAVDAWRDIQKTRTWWFRALAAITRRFKGPTKVAEPGAVAPVTPTGGNGTEPSRIIRL